MIIRIFWYFVLLPCTTICGSLRILESKTTTESLIKHYGYPFEHYDVITDDDYIVTLHRIPFSPNNRSNFEEYIQKPVVLMVHGFAQSSGDWILNGSPRSLGLLLADKGYDVWLANVRGSRLSKKHLRFDALSPEFWRFSWHEIGAYDLPAFIKFILAKTSTSKIKYIGHSQGTTAFMVAACTVDGFNEYIQAAYFLAPVAFISHAKSPIFPPLAFLFGQPDIVDLTNIGDFEILPNSRFFGIIGDIICGGMSILKELCLDVSNFVYGLGSKQTNVTALKIFSDFTPSGASARQLFHYLQLYNSKKFRQFDYGFLANFRHYNQGTPLDYQLNKITAPIFIYYSQNDAFVSPKDINILVNSLPSSSLRKLYKIPMEDWNHIDYLLGNNVDKILYSIVLKDLESE